MVKNINVVFGKSMKAIKRKKSGKRPMDSPFKKSCGDLQEAYNRSYPPHPPSG
jgi:hypothetical protein